MSIRRTPENTFERPEELKTPPAAPRSLRRTVDVARPEVQPTRARGVPGRLESDYEPMVLEHPRSRRPNRSKSRRNHAIAGYTAVTLALLAAGAAADRLIQSSNHPYNVAAELQRSSSDVPQELINNGAEGVALVPVSEGENVGTVAAAIATHSASDEVADILEAQQGSDSIQGSLAALPIGDLKPAVLQGLPGHGKVTVEGLVALQGQVKTIQNNPQ
jgi:hypothetical protein